jgi:hypothetical protein
MRTLKPKRRAFPGHALVQHGPADWRCKCGLPLRSWRYLIESTSDDWRSERIELTGRDGAREAMALHRAVLWLSWDGRL